MNKNLAIFGFGNIAKYHARDFIKFGYNLVAILGRNEENNIMKKNIIYVVCI